MFLYAAILRFQMRLVDIPELCMQFPYVYFVMKWLLSWIMLMLHHAIFIWFGGDGMLHHYFMFLLFIYI